MNDTETLVKLYMDGFPSDSESFARYFVNSTIAQNRLTYEVDGKTVCAGYIFEKPAYIFGRKTILPYLSALSTLTPYRGKGLIGKLIENAFNVLLKRGYDVVALSPFSKEYYLRYGFATVSYGSTKIIEGGENYSVRYYAPQDNKAFFEAYDKMTAKFDNFLKADETFLKSKLDEYSADNIKCRVLNDGNEDFAFVFVDGRSIEFYVGDAAKLNRTESLKGYKYTVFGEDGEDMIQARILSAQSVLSKCLYTKENKSRHIRIKDGIINKNNIEGIIDCNYRKLIESPDDCFKIHCEESVDGTVDISKLTQSVFTGGMTVFEKQTNFFCDKY